MRRFVGLVDDEAAEIVVLCIMLTLTHLRLTDVCDNCGGELYQRDDDKTETVNNRLYVYYKQTSPLVGYYFAKELLVELDGAQSIQFVTGKASIR